MTLRKIIDDNGWLIPLLKWLVVPACLGWIFYFRAEFVTHNEAAELLALPPRIAQVELHVEATKSFPTRLTRLEDQMDAHTAQDIHRAAQIEEIKAAVNAMAIQQATVITKLEDLARRSARLEDKVDDLTRLASPAREE